MLPTTSPPKLLHTSPDQTTSSSTYISLLLLLKDWVETTTGYDSVLHLLIIHSRSSPPSFWGTVIHLPSSGHFSTTSHLPRSFTQRFVWKDFGSEGSLVDFTYITNYLPASSLPTTRCSRHRVDLTFQLPASFYGPHLLPIHHVSRLDTSVLPCLRQADGRSHVLLPVVPVGRLREDVLDAQLRAELASLQQHHLLLDLRQSHDHESCALPTTGLRLQQATAVDVEVRTLDGADPPGTRLEPAPLAVELPCEPLLHEEQLLNRVDQPIVREGDTGAHGVRPLLRVRETTTQAITLKASTIRLNVRVSSIYFLLLFGN